jgi:hypothetical protein
MEWGGAQWLMVFLFAIRAIIGLAFATGQLTFNEPRNQFGRVGQYIGARIVDCVLIVILVWGGFW